MNASQAEAMKTCFGILAIMSREETNKLLIAKDGMEKILNVMSTHIERTDVQEAGCDLLWSLAFNNSNTKEIIANCGGSTVLVRALKRHSRASDFLKSACGALSNICQLRSNQEAVASQGGLQPLIAALHIHQSNSKLLPFIFDAIASIIVNNEDNARSVSALGIIPVVVASLSRHKTNSEVVKSGCHALAILSDVKGQASKIAFAGGVPVILSLLDQHPIYTDLHRVAAVVLLRMLQESSHVGKEICCHEGVRILLYSLDRGGAQQDTVAAITHILYTITNPNSPSFSSIEPQLWITADIKTDLTEVSAIPISGQPILSAQSSVKEHSSVAVQTALGGVVRTLEQYSTRRDVVRATCRLLTNLVGYPHVAVALDKLYLLDVQFVCVSVHRETKDVVEATCTLLKVISKRKGSLPNFRGNSLSALQGLFHVISVKIVDEEALGLCMDLLLRLLEKHQENWFLKEVELKELQCFFVSFFDEAGRRLFDDLQFNVRARNASSYNSKITLVQKMLTIANLLLRTHLVGLDAIEAFLGNCGVLSRNLLDSSLSSNSQTCPYDELVRNYNALIVYIGNEKQAKSSCESVLPSDDSMLLDRRVLDSSGAVSHSLDIAASDSFTESAHQPPKPLSKSASLTEPTCMVASNETIGKWSPSHPLKSQNGPRCLLGCWPNYLERLLPPSFSLASSLMQNYDNSPPRMHICYENHLPGGRDIASKCATPLPYIVPSGGVGATFEHSLTFDSDFESGNLYRAVQVGENCYDLVLRADVHTQGHTQWFYFAVSNTHPQELLNIHNEGGHIPPVRVKFTIINFTKPDSLFNLGMRPVIYSAKQAADRGIGWIRAGSDIAYYANSYIRSNTAGEGVGTYYSLTFSLEFHHPNDTVLIAYSYPYTMNDYKMHLEDICFRCPPNTLKRLKLCTTLGGNDCEMLVITDYTDKERVGPIMMASQELCSTDDSGTGSVKKLRDTRSRFGYKPAVFLSGRVHPGETPASWMMKGILDFLVGDSPSAILLRKMFVIFVVPILNPDGVILGNNRCSLAGVDLNRQWKTPDKANHPTVYNLKLFMMLQKKIREIAMFIDLHGHSRKSNVFMYGCDDKKKSKAQVRAFPRLLANHHIASKYVCFEDCSFHVKKGRESTARVVAAKEMGIACSFTLEATFSGSNYGPLKDCHMNIGHLLEVGAALGDAILKFSVSEGYGKDYINVVSDSSVKPIAGNFGTSSELGYNLQDQEMDLERGRTSQQLSDPGADIQKRGLEMAEGDCAGSTQDCVEDSDSDSDTMGLKPDGDAPSEIADMTNGQRSTTASFNSCLTENCSIREAGMLVRADMEDNEIKVVAKHTNTTHSISGDSLSNTSAVSPNMFVSPSSLLTRTVDVINDG